MAERVAVDRKTVEAVEKIMELLNANPGITKISRNESGFITIQNEKPGNIRQIFRVLSEPQDPKQNGSPKIIVAELDLDMKKRKVLSHGWLTIPTRMEYKRLSEDESHVADIIFSSIIALNYYSQIDKSKLMRLGLDLAKLENTISDRFKKDC